MLELADVLAMTSWTEESVVMLTGGPPSLVSHGREKMGLTAHDGDG
jgi:hypothetical protein